MVTNPFAVLGISPDATPDDIKTAFRKKAREYHPDLNPNDPGAEAKFKEVNEAYEMLKNPQKTRAPGSGPHEWGFEHLFHDLNLNDIFNAFHAAQRQRNPDIHVQTSISLREAFYGCTKQVMTNGKPVTISIPAGADTGMTFRVAGAGHSTYPGMPPGDLLVRLQVYPDQRFARIGANLVIRESINAFDAMTGSPRDVVGIDGQTISIVVPPSIQHGQKLRVAGHGMPVKGGQRGDLLIDVEISVPRLDPSQIEKLREFRSSNGF